MEGIVVLVENPKLRVILERSGGVYWVRGWVYYPVPEAVGDEVTSNWFFYVGGEMNFLVEKIETEEERKWTISRILSFLFPDKDIFIRGDVGETNYERLIDHLVDKFRGRLETEIRSAIASELQIDNKNITMLHILNPKISLRRPKNGHPTLSFGSTVSLDLTLPVKFFYEELSYNKEEVSEKLFFLGDVAYEALPDELKDPNSLTKLLTETFPIMKRGYKLVPQGVSTEFELWEVEIRRKSSFSRAGLSVLEFHVPFGKDLVETLVKNREDPKSIVSNLIVLLSFFPDGKIPVGNTHYYARVYEKNEFGMFQITVPVSELIEALRMFNVYGFEKGGD